MARCMSYMSLCCGSVVLPALTVFMIWAAVRLTSMSPRLDAMPHHSDAAYYPTWHAVPTPFSCAGPRPRYSAMDVVAFLRDIADGVARMPRRVMQAAYIPTWYNTSINWSYHQCLTDDPMAQMRRRIRRMATPGDLATLLGAGHFHVVARPDVWFDPQRLVYINVVSITSHHATCGDDPVSLAMTAATRRHNDPMRCFSTRYNALTTAMAGGGIVCIPDNGLMSAVDAVWQSHDLLALKTYMAGCVAKIDCMSTARESRAFRMTVLARHHPHWLRLGLQAARQLRAEYIAAIPPHRCLNATLATATMAALIVRYPGDPKSDGWLDSSPSYDAWRHTITMPLSMFVQPRYNPLQPIAAVRGVIGYALAHEMAHALIHVQRAHSGVAFQRCIVDNEERFAHEMAVSWDTGADYTATLQFLCHDAGNKEAQMVYDVIHGN